MLERVADGMQKQAGGFLLTTFQKLNASSTAAIKAALEGRLKRLRGELPASQEDEEDEDQDERYEGEWEAERALKNKRETMKDKLPPPQLLLPLPSNHT